MITIKIQTGNAAFEDSYSKAVNKVLLQVQDAANKREENPPKGTNTTTIILWDDNGNSVGWAKFDNK